MIKPRRDCFTASVAEKQRWFKDAMWDGELGRQATLALKYLLQDALEEEITQQLGVARYQRGAPRRDYRNGSYRRRLDTPAGPIDELRVPRSREGVYEPQVFTRYQRRLPVVNDLILQAFLAGASTRRVSQILQALLDAACSPSTVSQVARKLDKHVTAYHQRPLEDRYRYLLLDGIRLRCKGADGPRTVLVLVAFGFTQQGHRELIDFRQARSEGEAPWTAFLENLRQRGLSGEHLQLVTTDGARGLLAALDMVFPYVPRQRCWVHKLRNVSTKLRHAHRDACLQEAKAIYLAPTRRHARRCFQAWRRHWAEREPQAVACLVQDLDDLLTCFDLPPAHRPKVRTTNPIERAFREVRRRTRPISCFNHPASIERIVFAVLTHLNTTWSHRPALQSTQHT